MTANSLIDDILLEINKVYQPGLLMWLKSQPDRWNRLLTLEDRINQAALAKDEGGVEGCTFRVSDLLRGDAKILWQRL